MKIILKRFRLTFSASLLFCFAAFSLAYSMQCVNYSDFRKSQALWIFFGHLKGRFVDIYPHLADQLLYGLEFDLIYPMGGGPGPQYPYTSITRLPRLTDERYFDFGSNIPGYGPGTRAAIIIGCTGKVYSAALFRPNGLMIFVRNKDELTLATKTFQNWAQPLWDQAVWEKETGPHMPIKIFVLEGYGDRSVN